RDRWREFECRVPGSGRARRRTGRWRAPQAAPIRGASAIVWSAATSAFANLGGEGAMCLSVTEQASIPLLESASDKGPGDLFSVESAVFDEDFVGAGTGHDHAGEEDAGNIAFKGLGVRDGQSVRA